MTSDKLKVLDLFSGIGGFSLGLERTGGFETVAFCEIEEFPQKVLKKHWPAVPIYNDVRTLDYDGPVDLITGGYPCQPFSLAGKRQGQADDRHLWPAMFRLIQKHRPTWVIGENVAGHISMGLDDVLTDLEGAGYTVRTFIIPAVAVDAKHRRDRLWIVAHTECTGTRDQTGEAGIQERRSSATGAAGLRQGHGTAVSDRIDATGETMAHTQSIRKHREYGNDIGKKRKNRIRNDKPNCCRKDVANPIGKRGCSRNSPRRDAIHADSCRKTFRHGSNGERWTVEPGVGRVAHGIPKRVDRLKGLGNAVVPQIPEIIGYAILEAEFQNRSQL